MAQLVSDIQICANANWEKGNPLQLLHSAGLCGGTFPDIATDMW